MKIVESFLFEGAGRVKCPQCNGSVSVPNAQSVLTFLCPMCKVRSTLKSGEEEVRKQLAADPSMPRGLLTLEEAKAAIIEIGEKLDTMSFEEVRSKLYPIFNRAASGVKRTILHDMECYNIFQKMFRRPDIAKVLQDSVLRGNL